MLVNNKPNNLDTDDAIRQWAINNRIDKEFITHIDLRIVCKDAPDIAVIHWCLAGKPVRRHFKWDR